MHRSAEKYQNIQGRWDMVGGRIDAGIGLMENLQREVSEETGLTIVGTPKLIAAQDILRKAGYHVVRLSYLGKAEGEIKLDTTENDEYKWYSKEELEILEDMDVYLKELIDSKKFFE